MEIFGVEQELVIVQDKHDDKYMVVQPVSLIWDIYQIQIATNKTV